MICRTIQHDIWSCAEHKRRVSTFVRPVRYTKTRGALQGTVTEFCFSNRLLCDSVESECALHCYYYYSVFCLTTGPKPPPKRFLHIVRSKASSFKWEYPPLSLRSSSSFLRLLPRLHVTSISPFIFPSITCFRRQFLRKMWPIQLAFRFRISRRIFLCSCVCIVTRKSIVIVTAQRL